MAPITNLPQLQQLMNSTLIYAIIVGLVAFIISLVVSNMFPWEGGNDKSYVKRRIAFVVIGLIAVLGFWLYNDLVVVDKIKNAGFQNMFKTRNLICVGVNLGVYLFVCIIMMFVLKHKKFGSILPKKFKN